VSARRKPKGQLRPFPQVGDFVVIGHGIWSEPDQWWIAECEWSDGEQFLVRDTKGWHPTHQPYLGEQRAVMAIGTLEQCRAVIDAARTVRFQHIEAFREASVALQSVKDKCTVAIIDAVEALAGGIRASGRIE